MNTFLNQMTEDTNVIYTENGAKAYKSTRSALLDLFAFGAAYRKRSDEDAILLFKNAFEEDKELALKCLFYIADIRGGQGERRFFRVCFKWLCNEHPEVAKRNLKYIPEYRRWDDLIYATEGTPLEEEAFYIIRHQLALDIQCKTPSLLAKWMPSINTSNLETKRLGRKIAKYLYMTEKEYRKTLSVLRERIKVLEKLMSANRWDEISFEKITRLNHFFVLFLNHMDMTGERPMMENDVKQEKNKVDEVLRWVTFQLEKEVYGVNVMQVQEVLRYTEIAPVPGAPDYVLGIINLRGNVVTIIDTRMRFGLSPAEITDNTRIIIIEVDKQVVGILVDRVSEVVDLYQHEIDPAPNVGIDANSKFIKGVCYRNDCLMILIDLEKLLTDDEWQEINNFN